MTRPVHRIFRSVYPNNEYYGNRSSAVVNCHWLWCPGCNELHQLETRLKETRPDFDGPLWDWNGKNRHPTFHPSLLVTIGKTKTCHSFIRDGKWEFLPDSWHELAGQTVDLVPLPDWFGR